LWGVTCETLHLSATLDSALVPRIGLKFRSLHCAVDDFEQEL
jgi:hypothetical protein